MKQSSIAASQCNGTSVSLDNVTLVCSCILTGKRIASRVCDKDGVAVIAIDDSAIDGKRIDATSHDGLGQRESGRAEIDGESLANGQRDAGTVVPIANQRFER